MVRRGDETLVLDSGAVIGLARGDSRLRAFVAKARRGGADVVVPMVVIAETIRGNGPRDASVNLTIGQFAPYPLLDEPIARLAGSLLGAAKSNSTIDALVAAEAINKSPSLLVTSDVEDMGTLLDGHPGVSLERI